MPEATREDILQWLERGLAQNASHVLIVCDTFDWDDYPVYVKKDQNIHEEFKKHNNYKNKLKVMEVYNLALPIEPQMEAERTINF